MLNSVLNAIAEPRRRELLWLVRTEELTAGELADHFPDVTRPAVSQHLRVLQEAGLVSVRQAGTRRYYQARPDGLNELREFLDAFWESRLNLLKEAVENDEWRLYGDNPQQHG